MCNEYTLVGVMHFVDKWLNDVEPYSTIDDPDGQIAVERAAEARRVTLEYIEELQKQLNQVTMERDAALTDLWNMCSCKKCKHIGSESLEGNKCINCWLRTIPGHPELTHRTNWEWRGVG